MSAPVVAFALASATYLGIQATIRLVVYPQFASVPDERFPAYARAHARRVSLVVGPLFVALVASASSVVLAPPAAADWTLSVALVPTVLILALTGLGAVPQHRRLSRGFDPGAHRRLLAVDSLRLTVAAAGAVVAVLLLVA